MGTVLGTRISFRPLRRTDLVRLRRWLNAGEALRWYGKGKPVTQAEVTATYLPKVRGEVPTRGYVAIVGRAPVGYVQAYRIRDWPDYARRVAQAENAAGLDLFLGEPAFLHRGIGPEILAKFLDEVVWPTTGCASCIVGPHPHNRAAIRAFEKAGFRTVGAAGDPAEPGAERVMRIDAPPAKAITTPARGAP